MWGKGFKHSKGTARGGFAPRLGGYSKRKIGDGVEDGVVKYRDKHLAKVQARYTIGAKKQSNKSVDKGFLIVLVDFYNMTTARRRGDGYQVSKPRVSDI